MDDICMHVIAPEDIPVEDVELEDGVIGDPASELG